MLDQVGIICFAATYLIVFCLELIRRRKPLPILRLTTLGVAVLGFLAHTVYVSNHFIFQNERIVVSVCGWFFLLAWGLMLPYFYFFLCYSKRMFGLFVLPLVFLLIGGGIVAGDAVFPEETSGQLVRALHGISLLIATLFILLGFMTGGMFFIQSNRLKKKRPLPMGISLPSLEWLQTANRRCVTFSVFCLGIGVFSGLYLNDWVLQPIQGINKLPLSDPMISGTIFLFLVMLGFRMRQFFIKYPHSGKSTAWLTVACAFFLLTILLIGIFSKNSHWRKPEHVYNLRQNEFCQKELEQTEFCQIKNYQRKLYQTFFYQQTDFYQTGLYQTEICPKEVVR